MAMAICQAGPDVLTDQLVAIDNISALNSEAAGSSTSWSVAVAVSEVRDLSDQWLTALRVILIDTPSGTVLESDTSEVVGELLEFATTTTRASVWDLLSEVAGAGRKNVSLFSDFYARYIERVLNETDALLEPMAPRVPSLSVDVQEAMLPKLREVFLDAAPRFAVLARSEPNGSVLALRYLDLLCRAGVALDVSQQHLRDILIVATNAVSSARAADIFARVGVVSAPVAKAVEERLARTRLPLTKDAAQWIRACVIPSGKPENASVYKRPTYARVENQRVLSPTPASPSPGSARVVQAIAAVNEFPDDGVTPRDWTLRLLQKVGEGTPWSVEDLAAFAEAVGAKPHVDLTAEACRAVLDIGLQEPSAELSRLIVEQNYVVKRDVDDYERELLWLARVLGDDDWPRRIADPRTAARVVDVGMRIGLDRDRVELEEWRRWAPYVLVAATRLATLSPVHLDFDQSVSSLAGADIAAVTPNLKNDVGSRAVVLLAKVLDVDEGFVRDLEDVQWRLSQNLEVDSMVSADFLLTRLALSARTKNFATAALDELTDLRLIAAGPTASRESLGTTMSKEE
jgi:hypothetical protein